MKTLSSEIRGVLMNSKLMYSFFVLLAFLFIFNAVAVQAEIITSEFVDMTFTIDSKEYVSRTIKKKMDMAPFIENGTTQVPFRTIFEELGFTVEWNASERMITATRQGNQMKLVIDNNIAVVNGAQKLMSIAPKIINGRTFVPLRFVAENAGSNVVWDAPTRTINITRVGKYDTGGVLFYEKGKNNQNKVYVYDGNDFKVLPMENKSIVNWYSYKGKVLLTIFDSTTSKNNFAQYKNGKFEVLINDFDIQETFEYNDNLLIHGYDREQKFNKLYRFDGQSLSLIEGNFYVGKHVEINGKLVINKYDNTRDYTLLVYDKNSVNPWQGKVLSTDFIIKETAIYDNVLYMTGVQEKGTNKPLASYNGLGTDPSYFKILHDNLNIKIEALAVYKGNIYIIENSKLKQVVNKEIKGVYFRYKNTSTYMEYTVNKIIAFNNKLYLGVTGGRYTDAAGKSIKTSLAAINSFVLEFENSTIYRLFIDEFKLTEFRLADGVLLSLGNVKSGETSAGKPEYKDPALFVYNGINEPAKTLDVLSIKDTLTVNNKLFINVTDKSRITDSKRSTMLVYEGNTIKNLVVDMETKYWESVGGSMVFSGYETGIKANKLYSYGSVFAELLNNYDVKYWNKVGSTLFVCGNDPVENKFEFYKFINANKVSLQDNMETIQVIKAKGFYHLVYSYDRDSSSPLKGKKILYIYDDARRNFIEMKINIEISDMIFME